MKSYSLYLQDQQLKQDFLPLTLNRSFSDLRIGLFSIQERWKKIAALQGIVLSFIDQEQADFSLPANIIPTTRLDLAAVMEQQQVPHEHVFSIHRIWELASLNQVILLQDMELVDAAHYLSVPPATIRQTGDHPIYVHPTASIDHCFINTEHGAVVIDAQVKIMSGAMLRGPLYIGEQSVVKMGAMLYEGTNIGAHCIVGGEIKNSIFHGHANKAHHGYIGDSYIGAWCNLGAGTTCSNLKNTAGKIKIWDMHTQAYRLANEKSGVFMGDFVRTAINTTINSGSIFGAYANVFNKATMAPKYIPPFAWSNDGQHKYDLDKLIIELEKWMKMKGETLSSSSQQTIIKLYNQF